MERVVKCTKGETSVERCGYPIVVLASTSLFGAAFPTAQHFADKERGALLVKNKKLHTYTYMYLYIFEHEDDRQTACGAKRMCMVYWQIACDAVFSP